MVNKIVEDDVCNREFFTESLEMAFKGVFWQDEWNYTYF